MTELLYQALETELGGVQVYRKALECVQNEDLRKEWTKYLSQTETHVIRLEEVCEAMGLDLDRSTPGRQVVAHLGNALVKAMDMALEAGSREAAEIVAAECVTLAETNDHMNWDLLGRIAEKLEADAAQKLTNAYEQIEDEEDEHLYHTTGWARELWIQALGMEAVLPPPEEQHHVKSAIGAARAKHARGK